MGVQPERIRREDLLGTVVDVTVAGAASLADARAIGARAFTEIERLHRIFNWFDSASELRRWGRGEVDPGPELSEVVALAEKWRHHTAGAFDVAAGGIVELWEAAAAAGREPVESDLADAVAAVQQARRGATNLNAVAKGWIVDRAGRLAFAAGGCDALTVNAGGDLLRLGEPPIIVGIEDPRHPYDNAAPLTRVTVSGAAATSGTVRRGWSIGGNWYPHVVDPRTGRPVGHVTSASVLGDDVAVADIAATALTVLPTDEGLAFCEAHGLACCVVSAAGMVYTNERWDRAEVMAQPEGALRSLSVTPRNLLIESRDFQESKHAH